MACATLKRPLDFDPLLHDHHKSPKRRRCTPMAVSPTPSTSTKPQHCAPGAQASPFGEVKPQMTNVVIAANIQAELRRMQRRRQIRTHQCSRHSQPDSQASSPPQECSSGSESEPEMMSSAPPTFFRHDAASKPEVGRLATAASEIDVLPSTSARKDNQSDERPIFNFKQVSLICERLVRERETAIREEYDRVLTDKLAEQYDAFVKFTYDQIQRRLNDRPMSYVS